MIFLNLLGLKSINIYKQNSNKNKQYKKNAKFLLQMNLKSEVVDSYRIDKRKQEWTLIDQ